MMRGRLRVRLISPETKKNSASREKTERALSFLPSERERERENELLNSVKSSQSILKQKYVNFTFWKEKFYTETLNRFCTQKCTSHSPLYVYQRSHLRNTHLEHRRDLVLALTHKERERESYYSGNFFNYAYF